MGRFFDDAGREWTIRLDAPLVKRVQKTCGILLTDLRADPFLELAANPVLLVDVLYVCCEKQAKAQSITDEQFGESLGASIADATAALEAAITDFFPPHLRSSLTSLRAKTHQMQTAAMTAAMQEMDNPEIANALAKRAKAEMLTALESIRSAPSAVSGSVTSSTDTTPPRPA